MKWSWCARIAGYGDLIQVSKCVKDIMDYEWLGLRNKDDVKILRSLLTMHLEGRLDGTAAVVKRVLFGVVSLAEAQNESSLSPAQN